MTGLEKLGVSLLLSAAVGLAPVTQAEWLTANWPQVCAVVAIAVAWGALTQRMKAVEKTQDVLATKESVEALHQKVDRLVEVMDRRHP